jgi:hypothetical protein
MEGTALSTAAFVARDERKGGAGNSGHTEIFMLSSQPQLWQGGQVYFLRRKPLQTRMRTMRVIPIPVVGDVLSDCTHDIVGIRAHPFVLHAAPKAPHEDVVAPSAAPVHGELAAAGQDHIGKFHCRALAPLAHIDDLGTPYWVKACSITSLA